MKVIIKEKAYDYNSDYPQDWHFAARDHFKFPVAIGPHKCFIKRFERKSQQDVSGWQLLRALRGKNEQNLPRLYDIVAAKENGKDIYYVFFDCIKGDTLDKLIADNDHINLRGLTEDLFKALQSLHSKNFWFADFCEKNIFCERGGRFLLIDLDSTQPFSASPDNDMYGSKDYWALVFEYYRDVMYQRNIEPQAINGASLNYLQVVFLLLKLKLLYAAGNGNGRDYTAIEGFDQLPELLNVAAPSLRKIYATVYRNNNNPLQQDDIDEIKHLVLALLEREEIVIEPKKKKEPAIIVEEPVIDHFTMSGYQEKDGDVYVVANNKPFVLNWQAHYTGSIELYKNNALYTTLDTAQKSISLKEFSDGRRAGIEYRLVAVGNNGRYGSASLKLRIASSVNESRLAEEPALQVEPAKIKEPVITEFAIIGYAQKNSNGYIINSGEYFTLNWKIKNSTQVELFKNGSACQVFDKGETNFRSKEVFDGKEKQIAYTLQASNEEATAVSAPINILLTQKTTPPPAITEFKTDKNNVESGQPYTLKWTIEHVLKLELYKNGIPFKTLDPSHKGIQLKEVYDGSEQSIKYTLVASNGGAEIKTDPVVITVKQRNTGITDPGKGWARYYKTGSIVLGVLLLLVAAWALGFFNTRPQIRISRGVPQYLYQDSAITIYGENFEGVKNIRALFNETEGRILSSSKHSLLVAVPGLAPDVAGHFATITFMLKANGFDIYTQYAKWLDKSTAAIKEIRLDNFYSDHTVTIYGNRLVNPEGKMAVYFNYLPGEIKNSGNDSMVVALPAEIAGAGNVNDVFVEVKEWGTTVYDHRFDIFNKVPPPLADKK